MSKWENEKEKPQYSLRFRMFSNTCCAVSSLNGGIPVINSNKHTPSDHQSTATPCFWLGMSRNKPVKLLLNSWKNNFCLLTRVEVLDLDSRVCPICVHSMQSDCGARTSGYEMVSVSILEFHQPCVLNWWGTWPAPNDKVQPTKEEGMKWKS